MSNILLVFTGLDTPALVRWAIADATSFAVVGSGSGAPSASVDVDRCILILPGALVVTTPLDLPKRITAQVRAALPLLLEDQLALTSGKPHCVVGPSTARGRIVGRVEAGYLKNACDELKAIGLSADLIVADYMLLPACEDKAVFVETGDMTLMSTGHSQGFALEPSLLSAVLPTALDGSIMKKAIWYGANSATVLAAFEGKSIEFEPHAAMDDKSLLSAYAKSASQYAGIDFLEGVFTRRSLGKVSWPNWRRTTLLAVAASLLVALLVGTQAAQMNNRSEAVDRASAARMANAIPKVRNLNHLRARLRELQKKEQGSFLALSNDLFQTLGLLDYVSVEQLQYDSQGKQMLVKVLASDIQSIHSVTDELAQNVSIDVSLVSSKRDGARYRAVISLRNKP